MSDGWETMVEQREVIDSEGKKAIEFRMRGNDTNRIRMRPGHVLSVEINVTDKGTVWTAEANVHRGGD